MNKSTLTLLAATTPVLIAFAGPEEKIAFHPKEGATVTKVFQNTMYYGLDEMEVLIDGQENPMMPEMEMDMEMDTDVVVTDTYGGVTDGRPVSVTRTFDEIGSEVSMEMSAEGGPGGGMDQSPSGSGSSPLENRTLEFTWDEDLGDYEVTFADEGAADDDLLVDLVEDMDLRGLLPTRPLDVGGSYDIPLKSLVDVLAPGGDLKVDMKMGDVGMGTPAGDPEMMSNVRKMFGDMLDGSARGVLREMIDTDGSRIAVIDLTIDVDTASDMSEMMMDAMEQQGGMEGVDVTLERADVEFALEGGGELQWNTTAGHVHSLFIEGDTAMAMDVEMTMDMGGQSMNLEMYMEMSGLLESTVETQ